MARLNPAGTLLVIAGASILLGSVAALLIAVPGLTLSYPPSPAQQVITTVIQLSWFFIFFGSFTLFMGIRRLSPVPVQPSGRDELE